MSEVAPLEPFALEESLAGNETLPTLFDSALADETKTSQPDAPEPEPAARIDDGLSEDDDEPRLLTRAQKKFGKARITRTDSKADETYSPRVSSSKGGKKRFGGKRGSKNLPKPVIARKPVPTIIPVKEVPFLYDRILAALPQVDKQYYDSYAVQNLTICSILEVEKYAHEADPEEALFNDLVKIVLDDTSNKYKLTARQKNGRVDASWTKTDIGRDPMEVLSRYNELMMGDEEKAKRSYRAHNPERKDWTAADLRRFREAFLKYGAGPTSNKKIAQFMGIHPNQIAYIKQRIRRLARQREIETEFDRAAFEMVKDMKNVPDKVLFKHLRDKLIREDEEDKANKAAARKAKKSAAVAPEDGVAEDQQIEDENNAAENEISKDVVAEDPVGTAENETPANGAYLEQTNGHATAPALSEEPARDTSSAPSSQLASPEPSRSTEVSPTSRPRKRTKPQSTENQAKRRKTEHTPPKSVTEAAPQVPTPQSSAQDKTTPLPSPPSNSTKNRPLTEREQRLLKRKLSLGQMDDENNKGAGSEDAALLPPSRKKRNSGGDKAKQLAGPVIEISKTSPKSVEEEPIIADTTSPQALEPISSTDTNGPRSASLSEPVTPREFNPNPDLRPASTTKEMFAPPSLLRDYSTTPAAPVRHSTDDDGPAIMSRYAMPHPNPQLPRTVTSTPPPQHTTAQPSVAFNRTQRPPRPVSPQRDKTPSIPPLSDTPAHPMKHQWVPESYMANVPMQFNYSSSPAFPRRETTVPQQLPSTPISITPHIPAALMRTSNPAPANRSVPMVPQRSPLHNIPPLGTPLASFPMAAYTNYQQTPNYAAAPTVMQRTLNMQHSYNFNNGAISTTHPAPAKQPPQYSMITSPRDFEAAFTPFLINSPDFSAMNANQSAQQYGGPYPMLNYPPPQPRQFEISRPKETPTTFVPYVNNNAKMY